MHRQGKQHSELIQARARSHIFRRWRRVGQVRNFVVAWWLLWAVLMVGLFWQWHVLSRTYMKPTPVAGGTFTEGMIGTIDNMNPMFAIDGGNAVAARLVFNGLLRYDSNNQLVPDLAASVVADESGKVYTATLREGVKWHDGKPFTADDVVFTYTTIKHPDTRSPLSSSWRDVIITKQDDRTVVFTLPNAYAPFPHSLTTGVLPNHLLGSLGFVGQRPAGFNQAPIGTGPFRFLEIDADKGEATFLANTDYHRGKPKLDRMILRLYDDPAVMLRDYDAGILTAMADVPRGSVSKLDDIDRAFEKRSTATSVGVYAFYKTPQGVFADRTVRTALSQSISPRDVIERLLLEDSVLRGPLLPTHIGYEKKLVQPKFNDQAAAAALDQAGWRKGSDGIRRKDGQALSFTIVTQDLSDYRAVAELLVESWKDLGADVKVEFYPVDELQQFFVKTHDFEVLLYGIDLGADPDVFAYWHSSQATPPGLNLSEYSSGAADTALEAGRTRSDPELRAAKYRAFLAEWQKDVPALALYRRHIVYVQSPDARTFEAKDLSRPVDRFNDVENWTVKLDLK